MGKMMNDDSPGQHFFSCYNITLLHPPNILGKHSPGAIQTD